MRYVVVRPSADDAVARAFEQERTRREGSGPSAVGAMDVREVVDNDPASPRERTVCYAEARAAHHIASALNAAPWSTR